MECEIGDETVWTRQIWHSEMVHVTFSQSNIVALYLFLSQICGYRLHQRWINGGSTMYCWHLHCLHLQLLMTQCCSNSHHHPWGRETKTKEQRQRNAKVITEIERERVRGQEILIIEFWQNQIWQNSHAHMYVHTRQKSTKGTPGIMVVTSVASTCNSWRPLARTRTTTSEKKKERKRASKKANVADLHTSTQTPQEI